MKTVAEMFPDDIAAVLVGGDLAEFPARKQVCMEARKHQVNPRCRRHAV